MTHLSGSSDVAGLAWLEREVSSVCAPGTDPDVLARVLAWCARPRNSPSKLRRIVRDAGHDHSWSRHLAAIAGRPGPDVCAATGALVFTWRRLGARVALVGDPAYPAQLAAGWPQLDAPVWLVWRGAPPGGLPAVAIVGTRAPTSYGSGVAAWLADTVGAAGVRVVSGGAVGIDAAAHRAALETPGGTDVVLGCGHAVDYPRAHAAPSGLFEQVLEDGGSLVGELFPHEPPRAGRVRARNRIVAALADAVVVVEGGATSGGLLTAAAAGDWGRPVLAVPGDVRAPGSIAPHRLLAEGAAPCSSPDDVLDALGRPSAISLEDSLQRAQATAAEPPRGAHATDAIPRLSGLDDAVMTVLAAAWPRAIHIDDLAVQSRTAPPKLLAQLTRARAAGELAESPDGVRLRRAPR